MDRLRRSDFLDHLSGRVFLSHFDAVRALGSSGASDAPTASVSDPDPDPPHPDFRAA